MSAAFMLTPPTSAASPSPSAASALCQISRVLPTPRKHPLQSGSAKEVNLIHYLDDQLERVYRRHEKRLVPEQRTAAAPSKHDDAPGYESMEEVVQDLDPVVDIVWVSKTPTLQTAYLLQITNYIYSYITAFPFTPAVFPTLTKIDQAFVALLCPSTPSSTTTGTSKSPTKTDRVRIKSLIEETRVATVKAALQSGWSADIDDSDDDNSDEFPESYDESSISAGLGKVFKGTLEILGDSLTS